MEPMRKIAIIQASEYCSDCNQIKVEQSAWREITEEQYIVIRWWIDKNNEKRFTDKYYIIQESSKLIDNIDQFLIEMNKEKMEVEKMKEEKQRKREIAKAQKAKLEESKEKKLLADLQAKYGISTTKP